MWAICIYQDVSKFRNRALAIGDQDYFCPLLLHSLMLDSIRLSLESVGAIAITGEPSEIRAIGPCFNSPGKERHGM